MDRKTTGLIATITTGILCGCPGIFILCWGAIATGASFVPGAQIDIGGSSDPQGALITGLVALCGGLIFLIIPIGVGFFSLREEPEEEMESAASPEVETAPEPEAEPAPESKPEPAEDAAAETIISTAAAVESSLAEEADDAGPEDTPGEAEDDNPDGSKPEDE